ncbi:hypothetical protein BC829DRAFT_379806 [Chytridium lagenaria]|nr:hypothetical protein BC829DRAFT_379806 [Chytridium lagenaria]
MERIWRTEGVEEGLVYRNNNMNIFSNNSYKKDPQLPILNLGFDASPPTSILTLLITHDLTHRRHILNTTSPTCPICFTILPGRLFTLFTPCHHTFCTSCVTTFLHTALHNLNIPHLGCPHLDCIHRRHDNHSEGLDLEMLREIVGDDAVAKIQHVTMKGTTCPRCAGSVARQSGGKVGVGGIPEFGEKLCVCTSCGYPFCYWCKALWHGVQDCVLLENNVNETLMRYSMGGEVDRRRLEYLYGGHLDALIAVTEDKMRSDHASITMDQDAVASETPKDYAIKKFTQRSKNVELKHCHSCHQDWNDSINRDTRALRNYVTDLQRKQKTFDRKSYEDAASLIWVYENGSMCPGCGIAVELVDGCFRMVVSNAFGFFLVDAIFFRLRGVVKRDDVSMMEKLMK